MKPPFAIRVIAKGASLNPSSIQDAKIAVQHADEKRNQIVEAVEWWVNKSDHSALKKGLSPLIKDRNTIDKRLTGKMHVGSSGKDHLCILTIDEEKQIVLYVKVFYYMKKRGKKQEQDRQAFYKCKFECVCKTVNCAALGLKECTSCANILRSVCSKARQV